LTGGVFIFEINKDFNPEFLRGGNVPHISNAHKLKEMVILLIETMCRTGKAESIELTQTIFSHVNKMLQELNEQKPIILDNEPATKKKGRRKRKK
jgi:hypothetical protein